MSEGNQGSPDTPPPSGDVPKGSGGEMEELKADVALLLDQAVGHRVCWHEQSEDLEAAAARILSRITSPSSGGGQIKEFAARILHGDDDHRSWLSEAAECFIAGRPLPQPRGKGTAPTPPDLIQAAREAGDRCPECGLRSWARVDERKPDGSFGPGPMVRCLDCKALRALQTTPRGEEGSRGDGLGDQELIAIREMLLEGQGDDDGSQILPDFREDMTVHQMVAACVHLLECRRDALDGYANSGETALVGDDGRQPIETAPRDGQPVLLELDRGEHGDIHRAPIVGYWNSFWQEWLGQHNNMALPAKPIGWRPLPWPSQAAMLSAAPTPDANSGGEAAGSVPDGWEFSASLSCMADSRWQVTLRRKADGHLVTAGSVASLESAHAGACELAHRAPGLRLAEGCCSAVSPCSHQKRSPYTICDICQKATNLSAAPHPSQEKDGQS